MDYRSLLALVAALSCAACAPDPKTGTGQEPQRITGTERLGWTQSASGPAEFFWLRFAAYVDGTRSELRDALCTAGLVESAFDCSSSLPPMSPGLHTIELATYFVGFETLESARSSPIQVLMTGAGTAGLTAFSLVNGNVGGTATELAPPTLTTTDGVRVRVEIVADGLADPTDVAFAPDGLIFVAERAGRIRVVRDGVLRPAPAAALENVTTLGEGGLLGLAVDPLFERNRFVYAVHTTPAGAASAAFRVIRFRETRETLVDSVVLLDGIPSSGTRPAASVRFGPDGKLYLALDDGGSPALAGDLGSFSGKVLRMNADGSTPDDQAAATPVYSSGHQSPRGLAWQPGTDTLWVADVARLGSQQLTAVAAAEGLPVRARTVVTFALPASTGAAGMSFYRGQLIPAFRSDLFVAAATGGHILRVRFDPGNPLIIIATERLFEGRVGRVRAVAVGLDEAVYFCTDRALAKLVPDGLR